VQNTGGKNMELIGYMIESSDMEKLRWINKRLFGNGKTLTPDERRDLANLMSVILSRVEPVTIEERT
jgi:hypothetical protein